MDMVRFQEACASIREDASTLPRRVLDVGFLGATLPNLTAALALCSHYEGARIQIFEKKEDISSEDFVVAISTDAWKALTALCPLLTRALMSRDLLLNYKVSSEEPLIQTLSKETVYTTSGRILGLLSSVLPAGTITTGVFPTAFVDTSEGVDLTFEDGSIITAKLLIDAEVSTEEEAEHSLKYAEVMFQVSGGLSHLSGSHWIDHQAFATCHDLGGNVHIVTAVVGEHGMERSIECVRQFPEVYGCLMGSSIVGPSIRWLSCAAEQYSGNWRSTNLSNFLRLFPYISEQMLENVLGLALVLKNSICEKGLTPAALREVERLSHEKLRAQGFVTQQPSKLFSAWGLAEQQVGKAETRCHSEDLASSPPKSMNDITLAKGLVYPGRKEGMGWRIMS